jgi:hypothetical protein
MIYIHLISLIIRGIHLSLQKKRKKKGKGNKYPIFLTVLFLEPLFKYFLFTSFLFLLEPYIIILKWQKKEKPLHFSFQNLCQTFSYDWFFSHKKKPHAIM